MLKIKIFMVIWRSVSVIDLAPIRFSRCASLYSPNAANVQNWGKFFKKTSTNFPKSQIFFSLKVNLIISKNIKRSIDFQSLIKKSKSKKYRFFILHSVLKFEPILRITNKITELGEKKIVKIVATIQILQNPWHPWLQTLLDHSIEKSSI